MRSDKIKRRHSFNDVMPGRSLDAVDAGVSRSKTLAQLRVRRFTVLHVLLSYFTDIMKLMPSSAYIEIISVKL